LCRGEGRSESGTFGGEEEEEPISISDGGEERSESGTTPIRGRRSLDGEEELRRFEKKEGRAKGLNGIE
jgi:hypothetical protein